MRLLPTASWLQLSTSAEWHRAAYFSPSAAILVSSLPVEASIEKKSEMPLPSPAVSPTSAATTSGLVETMLA